MKGLMICVLATAWVGLVIYRISRKPAQVSPLAGWAETYAMPQHPAGADEVYRDRIDQAHRGGKVQCPAHGAYCARALLARRTGLSQTDEDVGRRAAINAWDSVRVGQAMCPVHGWQCWQAKAARREMGASNGTR